MRFPLASNLQFRAEELASGGLRRDHMLTRFITTGVVVCTALLAWAQPAHAQQQTVNFTLGYFTPLGEDARTAGDVLNENLVGPYALAFDIRDFNGPSVGGEWLVPFGEYLEGGIGVSFTRRTVPSVYQEFVDPDGTEVDQDLRLRMVPLTFSVRLLPLGQHTGFQPYIGAGVGIVWWRYSETGEFVDPNAGNEIFRASYVATGDNAGPVVLGGVRAAGRTATAGFEIRYQKAKGDLPANFVGSKIDLGGWTYNFTVGVRF
jgi:hypothetical protein